MWSEIGPRRISCVRNPRRYIVTPEYRYLEAAGGREFRIYEVWTFAVHFLDLPHHRTVSSHTRFEE